MNTYAEEIDESEQFRTSTKQLRTILDDKYKKADFNEFMINRFQHLTEKQHNELLKLLQRFE